MFLLTLHFPRSRRAAKLSYRFLPQNVINSFQISFYSQLYVHKIEGATEIWEKISWTSPDKISDQVKNRINKPTDCYWTTDRNRRIGFLKIINRHENARMQKYAESGIRRYTKLIIPKCISWHIYLINILRWCINLRLQSTEFIVN